MSNTYTLSQQEVHQLAEIDLDFFAGLADPDSYTLNFPPVFVQLWEMLTTAIKKQTRAFDKFAVGLPRGFGKSNVNKLLILFAILFTKRRYILVVSASQQLAKDIIADVFDMLEADNIVAAFGRWDFHVHKDTEDIKVFNFRGRDIIIRAIGAGQAIRGTNRKQARPDLMIFDDAQTKESAASPTVAQAFRVWFYSTALKLKSPFGCTVIYVGNMYPNLRDDKNMYTCLLRHLKDDPGWTSFITGAIQASGKSLWPELQPIEQLLEELQADTRAGHPEIFMSEVMNDPDCQVNSLVDLTQIPQLPVFLDEPLGSYIILDPATNKRNSDDQVFGYFEVINNDHILRDIVVVKLGTTALVQQAIQLALDYKCPCIFVEDVAFQYMLIEPLESQLQLLGITDIKIRTVQPRGVQKNSRIRNLFKQLLGGDLLLDPKVRSAVFYQISTFDPTKTDNKDDILDVCAYHNQVKQEYLMDIFYPDNSMNLIEGSYEIVDTSSF